MSVTITMEKFIETIRNSELLSASVLTSLFKDFPDTAKTQPLECAKELLRRGLLTQLQAQQLLQGRSRGFIIGKYRILELLGGGGMGKVYLCEHTLLKKLVAIKLLPVDKAADPGSVARFFREARAALDLNHPNIVRAFDLDEDKGLHFLVLEFVDGIDLHEAIQRRGPLPPGQAANALAQAATGLQHAHEAGWVHRDIKPANLLLDRFGTVKLLDLGLVRGTSEENLTQKYNSMSILGTADYLAPEQAINSTNVDIRADIYSLGVTGYFLLTGKTPFDGGSVAQKIIGHQMRTVPLVSEVRPEIPKDLAHVIARMIQKQPDHRYSTPADVVEALSPWSSTPIAPAGIDEVRKWCPAIRAKLPARSEPTPGSGGSSNHRISKPVRAAIVRDMPGKTAAGVPRKPPRASSQTSKRRLIVLAGGVGAVCAVLGLVMMRTIWSTESTSPPGRQTVVASLPKAANPEEDVETVAGIIPADDAGKYAKMKATVELVVRNTGRNHNATLAFLNSELDYRSPNCFTVVINRTVEEKFASLGISDPLAAYAGKRIRVTGRITLYQERPQIALTDPIQLEVVADGAS